jgi:hypothetical protein
MEVGTEDVDPFEKLCVMLDKTLQEYFLLLRATGARGLLQLSKDIWFFYFNRRTPFILICVTSRFRRANRCMLGLVETAP